MKKIKNTLLLALVVVVILLSGCDELDVDRGPSTEAQESIILLTRQAQE